MARQENTHDPFRWFDSSPEVIRLVVMMYVKYPLSLRNVEDLLFERGIDICHETVRLWWNRFGPMFAAEIRSQRVDWMRAQTHWRWHLDEVNEKINDQMHYLWRAADHEGEVLESCATKTRDKTAALKFLEQGDRVELRVGLQQRDDFAIPDQGQWILSGSPTTRRALGWQCIHVLDASGTALADARLGRSRNLAEFVSVLFVFVHLVVRDLLAGHRRLPPNCRRRLTVTPPPGPAR